MTIFGRVARRPRQAGGRLAAALVLVCASTVVVDAAFPASASAESVPVPMGTAADFAVLAGTTITSTGLTQVTGDIGVSPGTAMTGFPPGTVNGAKHSNDGPAVQAKADLAVAYTNATGRTSTGTIATQLGATTKTTGVYGSVSGTFAIDGELTLDAEGDPNAVFIFKTLSTLITGADSEVTLANGAQACNVFWQVGSSATLGANSTLRGDLLAFTSITVGAGLTVEGRTLAINGAVTMDNDTVTRSTCAEPGELSITAPTEAGFGPAPPGATIAGRLGPVTVTDERLITDATWTATVTATDFVSADELWSISRADLAYWSGPALAAVDNATAVPGQRTAQDAVPLDVPRTTFTLSEGVGDTSVTWDPRIILTVPITTVASTYTGTLTFSVA